MSGGEPCEVQDNARGELNSTLTVDNVVVMTGAAVGFVVLNQYHQAALEGKWGCFLGDLKGKKAQNSMIANIQYYCTV